MQISEHISLKDNEAFSVPFVESIGIVDPFLKVNVKKGQKFWLFLNPKTTTGMKHHWSHPLVDSMNLDPSEKERLMLELEKIAQEINNENGGRLYSNFNADSLIYLAKNYWMKNDLYCGDYEEYDFCKYYPRIREIMLKLGINIPALEEGAYFRCAC